jgi:F-type H+-transporting ATPase subunit delta
MPKPRQSNPLALAYARSLLELADERGQLEQVNEQLSSLREIVRENPTFRAYLRDPSIGENERNQLLTRVFSAQLSPLLLNFLKVMSNHGRLGSLEAVADAYDDLLDERLGKIEVDITVAQRLSGEDLELVRRRVSEALKKEAVLHLYVDESIIGGMIVRVQDQLIDSSVRAQLQAMRQRMLEAKL